MLAPRVIKSIASSIVIPCLACVSLIAAIGVNAAELPTAETLSSNPHATSLVSTESVVPTSAAGSVSPLSVADQRQRLMQRLEQLEADNDRLREQLSQVKSSDESVRSLERVLESHNSIIDTLRRRQGLAARAGATEFKPDDYQAPAVGIVQPVADSSALIDTTAILAPKHQAAASIWSLELAGASGVLALIGALVLLFVITVLRKSYWMPRDSMIQRPAARVSHKGLAADVAAGYEREAALEIEALNAARASRSKTAKPKAVQKPVTAQEQARRDQYSMARMLEHGLALSEDDQAQIVDDCPVAANGQAKPATHDETATANAVAPREALKQSKNPLSGEYDLLGSNGFDSDFNENDEFDELFELAAQVPDAKDITEGKCRRSDEAVLQSIREKTFGYVPPVVDDGSYIVEEGCDDLDKYMDIAFIETPVVELNEDKERRDHRRANG